jgi:hypothetical protein
MQLDLIRNSLPRIRRFSIDAQRRYDYNPVLGSSFNCISSLELIRGGTIVLYYLVVKKFIGDFYYLHYQPYPINPKRVIEEIFRLSQKLSFLIPRVLGQVPLPKEKAPALADGDPLPLRQ